jgi:hypothetical protein
VLSICFCCVFCSPGAKRAGNRALCGLAFPGQDRDQDFAGIWSVSRLRNLRWRFSCPVGSKVEVSISIDVAEHHSVLSICFCCAFFSRGAKRAGNRALCGLAFPGQDRDQDFAGIWSVSRLRNLRRRFSCPVGSKVEVAVLIDVAEHHSTGKSVT